MKINQFNSNEKILKYTDKINYFLNAHKTLIVAELDLTNKCNHRCPGCCGNNENNAELSLEQIEKIVENLVECECQGVILSGGGEPTISPHFAAAVKLLKNNGINIGMNSHGMNLDKTKMELIAQNMEYFRISLDAGTPEMYNKIHGMNAQHFQKTLSNIAAFSEYKKSIDSKTSFGVGFLTSRATECDMESFVQLVKERGADFAQFRPFTGDTLDIRQKVVELREKYESDDFKIVASYQKYNEMSNMGGGINHENRGYSKCHGMWFSTCISADFKVWACLHFRQSAEHLLGDLSQNTLAEIFRSARMREVYNSINCKNCPILCRNDSFNKTLESLQNPIINSEFL